MRYKVTLTNKMDSTIKVWYFDLQCQARKLAASELLAIYSPQLKWVGSMYTNGEARLETAEGETVATVRVYKPKHTPANLKDHDEWRNPKAWR